MGTVDDSAWTAGETFIDPAGGIQIKVDGATASGFQVTIQSPANPCSLQSDVPAAECQALLAFYQKSGGPAWKDNSGWTYASPCAWLGVVCQGGHVTTISLASNGLSGAIPAELGSLPHLAYLFLNDNDLSGQIPAAVRGLPSLLMLVLDGNHLAGPLPVDFANQAGLQVLSLAENDLEGGIPASITGLSGLLSLDLHGIGLTGPIPASLGVIAGLQYLNLADNALEGPIPAGMANLQQLYTLNLGGNRLEGAIPAELGGLPLLDDLDLSYNRLSGAVPAALAGLAELDRLDIGFNRLTGQAPAVLAFLGQRDPDWAQSQTVPPASVWLAADYGTSVAIGWLPIAYTGDGGYYEVWHGPTAGGPFTLHGTTDDKTVSGYTADGLDPDEPHYFVVRAFTPAHGRQQNDLWSDDSHRAFLPETFAYLPVVAR
jgi:hypothetical protein